MSLLDKVKGKIKEGYERGMEQLKNNSADFKGKAQKLAGEGKKQLQVLELRLKIQGHFTKLGKRVFELAQSEKNS
ncbi:hypothetical protein MCHI_000388 [Candidatus Magnetoovum chiemensis]|nr:hypothetical protein MCHI_000388 [Candidatus Magnetoovum chiemensis]